MPYLEKQRLTSSASGSSRTHSDSASSLASSSSAYRYPRPRHGHGRIRLRGRGCAAAASGCGRSGALCCCLVRCPSRRSCLRTTRHWIRQLRGGRGICSILASVSQGCVNGAAESNTPCARQRLGLDEGGVSVPLLLFLPMPSLSMTSSAHWMCLRSSGSARRRKTPDDAFRRVTGFGCVSSSVWLPVSRDGVAVREGAFDIADRWRGSLAREPRGLKS